MMSTKAFGPGNGTDALGAIQTLVEPDMTRVLSFLADTAASPELLARATRLRPSAVRLKVEALDRLGLLIHLGEDLRVDPNSIASFVVAARRSLDL
ncbi:hypothetical protein C5D04_10055 [Rathayibacter sp. AY1D2]|jgi:DNA-binding transcriptional ArsR family regulator|nr:hypothetical protein C5C52_12600 [Rathayibacter sp. AY1E5]PPH18456.1 hypothetical protein C5C99_13705 [Rathayibacter sp. AY1C4]PPH27133.1 hypothetical protein C5C37_14390 [Rathayibacter sp. AY1F9]PPH43737.1 hypothetical protein C5D09_14595 [Rathayibacter sp. AY1C9]PPH65115.1 hypothetical protein C5D25_04655 [Rathayibacter sp. AY1D7]PPH96820.1 hypothetical protein C5C56_13800 [Rathayibacter sp. AY1D1]PPI13311.1 hypothetical protein C5D04_10055 [Rathayibacter sp. AY1D2]